MRGKTWPGVVSLGVMFLMVGGFDAWGEHSPIGSKEAVDVAEIPLDPVVEEPLRSLGTNAVDRLPRPKLAECGAMNGFMLPVGVLLVSGLGWIPRRRPRCAAPNGSAGW